MVVCRSEDDVQNIPDAPGMLEAFVDDEVSVIVARNESGDVKTFPVADQEFHPTANQVEYVLCPSVLSEEMQKRQKKLRLKPPKPTTSAVFLQWNSSLLRMEKF